MTTFAITTLGCKVNTYETESYRESLEALGYAEVDFRQKADVYVINTCCVTNTAASKSRQRISQAKRHNPNALLCVVGCYVQTHAEELKSQLAIDILLGFSGKTRLAQMIQNALLKKPLVLLDVESNSFVFEELNVHKFQHQTRAYLKIQDGCDQFCAYCIIPYARGRERSLNPTNVVKQAQLLSESHPEIVLVGIHTGRFGKEYGVDLTQMIEEILDNTPKLKRIRISSIEVTEITDAFIALMKREPRIARHLHIPIQSGCDATLLRMQRPYSIKDYLDKIAAIRKEIPDISISSDLIVGFPQEDEDEFLTTMQTMRTAEFSFMHVFPYSRRANTGAEKMDGHISPQCKKQRVQTAKNASHALHQKFLKRLIGKSLQVIVEEISEAGLFGHSSEYIPVMIPYIKQHQPKDWIEVIAVAIKEGNLIGEEH